MHSQASVDQWRTTIMQHLPELSKPQATVLALWSLGMVLARSCALTAVSALVAVVEERKENTIRQRLREWYYEAPAKRGAPRQALQVETCFAPLLGWIVSWWQGSQLALALDATTLGTCFVVLAISVVYRGCAIPVAWVLLPANQKHAWRGEWLRLLRRLWRVVPRHWTVIVLADRGLYAPGLFRRIVKLGWHPFLRLNTGGTCRPAGTRCFRPLRTFVPQTGTRWQGRGTAFAGKPRRLDCTLLACWEAGYKDPWLILTDLAPEASDAGWYGLRAWIEQGFKLTKRAGWQWHRTRMTDPARAARLWLAVAVATLWVVSIGGVVDATIPEGTLPDVSGLCPAYRRPRRATQWRLVSVFRQGWLTLMGALLRHDPLPAGRFLPEPWPAIRWRRENSAEEETPTLPRAA
jgi:DDE family transposase